MEDGLTEAEKHRRRIRQWSGMTSEPSYRNVEAVEQIFRCLLTKGAKSDTEIGHFGNASNLAAFMGNQHIMQQLGDRGADINASDGYCGNALFAAIEERSAGDVAFLLQGGINIKGRCTSFAQSMPFVQLRQLDQSSCRVYRLEPL